MASISPVASEKTFENVDRQQNLSDLEQRSMNNLDLQQNNFIWSFHYPDIPQLTVQQIRSVSL